MRSVLIAAGGGGDAVGAILARRCLAADTADPLLIAAYAWERVRVDPEPGPRPPGHDDLQDTLRSPPLWRATKR